MFEEKKPERPLFIMSKGWWLLGAKQNPPEHPFTAEHIEKADAGDHILGEWGGATCCISRKMEIKK